MVPGATLMSGSIDMGSLARAGAVRDFVVFATMFTSFLDCWRKRGSGELLGQVAAVDEQL
jgi:hypothetical protein